MIFESTIKFNKLALVFAIFILCAGFTIHSTYYSRVRNKPKSLGFRVRHSVNELGLVLAPISLFNEGRLGPCEQP